MIVKPRPLLCELHAHTTWSDGALTLPELVDLYGANGFDVLVVSDHAIRSDDPWPVENPGGAWVSERLHRDFHRIEHLSSWKTLLPCEKSEAAVVAYLRSARPAYVTRLERSTLDADQAAA